MAEERVFLTDEEGAVPHPDTVKKEQTKAASERKFLTDEEGAQPYAPPEPKAGGKLLDNAPDDTVGRGMAKGMVTGVAKVGLGLYPATWPGTIRDTANMVEAGAENYVRKGAKMLGQDVEDPGWREIVKRNSEAMPDFVNDFPNIQEAYETGKGIPGQPRIKDAIGEYNPETWYGRLGQTFFEAALARNPKRLLNAGEAVGAGVAGATAEGVSDLTGDPILGLVAGATTPKAVARTGQRVYDRVNPDSPGRDLARRVVQETPDDPLAVAGRLNAPPNGITQPNTVMQSQDRGVAALSNRLERGDEDFKSTNEGVEQKNTALVGGASEAQRAPAAVAADQAVAAIEGNLDPLTKAAASADTHSITKTLRDSDKANERSIWDAWRNRGDGEVRTARVQADLDGYLTSRPIRERELLETEFDLTKRDLDERASRGMSDVAALQDARSKLLEKARSDGITATEATAYNDAAAKLHQIITDDRNYRFNSPRNRVEWQKAVDTTNQFHKTWGDKTSAWLTDNTKDEGAFLNRVLVGQDAGKRTAELMAKVGSDPVAVKAIEDWHMGQLTKNGTKPVTAAQVDAFIGNNGAVINQIPGLENKLRAYGGLKREQQLGQMWQEAQGKKPGDLVNFLDNNRDEVKALTGNPAAVDGLEQAARQLDALNGKGPVNSETFNAMQNGRTSTLLYGASIGGSLGKVALAALAYKLFPEGMGAEALIGAAGAIGAAGHIGLHGKSQMVNHIVDYIGSGQARERAEGMLREALNDPKKWEALRRMSPRETAEALFGTGVAQTAVGAAIGTHEGVSANEARE